MNGKSMIFTLENGNHYSVRYMNTDIIEDGQEVEYNGYEVRDDAEGIIIFYPKSRYRTVGEVIDRFLEYNDREF